jgi:hypothetical protein
MKPDKIIACLLLMAPCNFMLSVDDYTSKTFLYPRPAFNSLGIQQASWSAVAYEKKQPRGGAFQVTAFYEQSYDTNNAAAYFLFNNKNQLKVGVGESNTTATTINGIYTEVSSRDILGQWLGLSSTTNPGFSGEFSLKPEQMQTGLLLEYSQDLKNISKISFFKNLYINVSAPVNFIENNLKYSGSPEIFKAFTNQNGNNWRSLLFPTEKQSSLAVSNLKLTLGTTLIGSQDIIMTTNSSLVIPLIAAGNNKTLFQPVQGYNGSFAICSQALFQFPIMKRADEDFSRVCFYFGFENVFVLKNKMDRTFDLKNKPFSRYMLLLDASTNKLEYGVNALTKKCTVEPYNFINVITGFRINHHKAVGEIGYEFWAHAPEKISLHESDPWVENRYGIARIDQTGALVVAPSGLTPNIGLTASESTIQYVAYADADRTKTHNNAANEITHADARNNVYIKASDIDFNSAASQKTHIHRPYVSLGLRSEKDKVDIFINLGAYLSASYYNSCLSTWGGWLKAGASF